MRLSAKALPFLEKEQKSINPFEVYAKKDPDYVEMFKLLETVRPLGLRGIRARFDIEFPVRDNLKVFLAKLISKRRMLKKHGMVDIASMSSTAIISSTDNCAGNQVSSSCKSIISELSNCFERDFVGK